MQNNELKSEVREFWNSKTCGTWEITEEKFTKEYFEEIEKVRYELQPELFSFAEFTRYHGKKLLEIGVGAGTDFLQWVRAGAKAYGMDLTEHACEHVRHRLDLYGLKAEDIRVGDCENLPYDDNSFEIIWSWGVIHHTPDTPKAFKEIIRVLAPGGKAKIMIYHRHSILTYLFWVKHALLKGKPWRSPAYVLWNYMESAGTKAYTVKEVAKLLENEPIKNVKIKPVLTHYDKLGRFNKAMQFVAKMLAIVCGGDKAGWFLTIEFDKK